MSRQLRAVLLAIVLAACGGGDSVIAPSTTTAASSTTTSRVSHSAGEPGVLAGPDEELSWAGTIDDDVPFSMTLRQDGRYLLGSITYDRIGTPILLAGTVTAGGDSTPLVVLQEFAEDGRVTGTLSFEHDGTADVSGFWNDRLFSARAMGGVVGQPLLDRAVAAGSYRTAFPPFEGDDECCGSAGQVLVDEVAPGRVTVSADRHRGAPGYNIAVIEDVELIVDDGRAFVDLTDGDFREDCAFEFAFYAEVVFIDHADERFDCGFGFGATIAGVYLRVDA